MEWLKFYNDALLNAKWQYIAEIAQVRVSEVFTVWMALLTTANKDEEDRGSVEFFKPALIDCFYKLKKGTSQKIFNVMIDEGLVFEKHITKWEQYQSTKAELQNQDLPEDQKPLNKSTARVRKFRDKQRQKVNETLQSVSGNGNETQGVNNSNIKYLDKESPIERGACVSCNAEGVSSVSFAENTLQTSSSPQRNGPRKTDAPSKGHPQWQAFKSCWQVWPVKQGEEPAWREWMRLHENGTLPQAWEIRDSILRLVDEDDR